jgi:hypothetical protein
MSTKKRIRGDGVELACTRCERRLPHDQFADVKTRGRVYVDSYCRECQSIARRERWQKYSAAHPPEKKTKGGQPACVRYDYAIARLFLDYTNDQAIAWLARGYNKLPETIAKWVDGVDYTKELEWLNTDVGNDALTDDGVQVLRTVG